jgi:hypothetical protein
VVERRKLTTFITDERPPMLAFLAATTKGEASAFEVLVPFRRFGPVYGVRHPMVVSEAYRNVLVSIHPAYLSASEIPHTNVNTQRLDI